jgi:mRNA interferase MazF
LRIIVPLTDWKDHYDQAVWMVKIEPDTYNNLSKISAADCFQIRSVAQQRFVRKIGILENNQIVAIEKALAILLKI